MTGAPSHERGPRKILVRAPNWVGDVVMATPAIRAIAKAHPAAEIVVEAREYLRPLIEPLPYVTKFLAEPGKGMRALRERVKLMRAERFDMAFILPDSHSTGVGPWMARIPVRAGFARDPLRRLMLTHALRVPKEGKKRLPYSMIERYLRVPAALGIAPDGDQQDVPVTEEARERVRKRMEAAGFPYDEPYLVIVPGANFGASKLWPVEHFATACDEIYARHGLRTAVAPGPKEVGIATRIVERMKAPAIALVDPVVGIDGAAAVTERARLVLCNDTGPRHFAVAMRIPCVVLIGPTDDRHTAHQLELQRVLREQVDCAPCGLKICPIDHRCMTRLAPERAVAAAEELLELTAVH